ncbi:hypothetical protein LUZ60_002365 [Juncus effusus]|nr:hypothetical protein LUZ60_002365 [Juncus effusus]
MKTAEQAATPEMETAAEREAEYHSKDFEWEELRGEIETDDSLQYHLSSSSTSVDGSDAASSSPVEADNWRSFHRRHSSARFFKERRYLIQEFPELVTCSDESKVLEIGCGNGSSIIPILRARDSLVVYACDCSEEIIEKTKEFVAEKIGIKNRLHAFVLDFSVDEFPNWLFCSACQNSLKDFNNEKTDSLVLKENQCCVGGVDFITMIFTLSAIPFNKMPAVIQKCASVLKPGGFILFRDYGLYDMTMLRFLEKQKVGFREYMRSDGTLSYFFSLDSTRDLFCKAGFIEVELEYCCVRSVNRRNGKEMRRVWVHGKFQKPLIS